MGFLVYLFPHILIVLGALLRGWGYFGFKHVCFFAFFVFVLVGFREGVGYDYDNYVELVLNKESPFLETIPNIFASISSSLNNHYVFFVLMSLITITPVAYSAKLTNLPLVFLMYIMSPFLYLESFTIVRQAAALGVGFLVYALFLNGKYYRAFLFSALNVMIHVSSILFFLFLLSLVFKKQLRMIYVSFFVVSCVFLAVFFSDIVLFISHLYPKFAFYAGQNSYGMGIFLSYCILYIFFLVIGIDFFSGASLMVAISFAAAGAFFDGVFVRLSYYFWIPVLFFLSSRSSNRLTHMIVAVFFSYFLIGLYIKIKEPLNGFEPYSNIFICVFGAC